MSESNPIATLIETSIEFLKKLRNSTERVTGQALYHAEARTIKGYTDRIQELCTSLHALDNSSSFTEPMKEGLLANVQKILGVPATEALTAEAAKNRLAEVLKNELETAKNATKNIIDATRNLPKAAALAEEGGSFMNYLKGMGETILGWHQNKLKNFSPEGRMMFGWGEFMLGSVLMGMGTRTFRQVWGGLKEKTVQKTGEDGKPYITFEVERMSDAERTLKGVVAGVELGVGTGMAIGGVYNLVKPH